MKDFLSELYIMFKEKSFRIDLLKGIFSEKNVLMYIWIIMLLIFGAPIWIILIIIMILPTLFKKDL